MSEKDKNKSEVTEDVSRRDFFVKALAGAPIAASIALAAQSATAGGGGGGGGGRDDDDADDDDD